MAEKEIPKILIVDDSPAALDLTEALLAGLGITIYKAGSGMSALRLVMEEDFALIILDVRMPEMNGISTAAMIRKNSSTKNIPIIFLSAFYQDGHQVESIYKIGGVVCFLSKPVVPEILRAKVSAFIELHRKSIECRLNSEEQKG